MTSSGQRGPWMYLPDGEPSTDTRPKHARPVKEFVFDVTDGHAGHGLEYQGRHRSYGSKPWYECSGAIEDPRWTASHRDEHDEHKKLCRK